MPKMLCPRNHLISLVVIPTPGERFYFRLVELDEIAQTAVDAFTLHPDDETPRHWSVSDSLIGLIDRYVTCLQCGAIVMFDEEPVRCYLNQEEYRPGSGHPTASRQNLSTGNTETLVIKCLNGHVYTVDNEDPSHVIMCLNEDRDPVIDGVMAALAASADLDDSRRRIKQYLLSDVTELHECPTCRAVTFLDDRLTSYLPA